MTAAELIALSTGASTLLAERHGDGESYQVREARGLRWIYTGRRSVLSAFRPAAPCELVFPNHVTMLAAIALCGQPTSVLNLGCGAGAFERFLRDRLAAAELVSVDASATVVDIAREFFQLPASSPVVLDTAERFLAHNRRAFDVVLCDIFAADAHPPCLKEDAFHADVARALAPGGVFAANLSPGTEQELIEILLPVRRRFPGVALGTIAAHGNVVLLAARAPLPPPAELARRARPWSATLGVALEPVMARLEVLPPP